MAEDQAVRVPLPLATVRAAANRPRVVECDILVSGWNQIGNDRDLPGFIPAEEVADIVRAFGGTKVYAFRAGRTVEGVDFFDHLPTGESQKWLREGSEVGYLHDGHVAETEDGRKAARFSLILRDDLPDDLAHLIRRSVEDQSVGLSIDAGARTRAAERDGKPCIDFYGFGGHESGPPSTDIVSRPAAHGRFRRLVASLSAREGEEKPMPPEAKQNDGAPGVDLEKLEDTLAQIKASQAAAEEANAALNATKAELDGKLAEIALTTKRADAVTQIRAAKLPNLAETLLVEKYESASEFDADAITKDIERARASLAEDDARVRDNGGIKIGIEPADRLSLRMEVLASQNDPEWVKKKIADRFGEGKSLRDRVRASGMDPNAKEMSFHRIFRDHTGRELRDLREAPTREGRRKVKAAIATSTFGDAWENVLNRRLSAWAENPMFGDWRRVARVTSVPNFLKQERVVMGGYPNLATVSEGASYAAITSPGDEGHGYTPTKRGNTEQFSWEAILRDDVGLYERIPRLLGTAAIRTLYEFVFGLVEPGGTNPTMDYDSTALYHASHSNTGTTALSSAALIAVYKAMQKQADISSSKRLLVVPRFLLVPIDLEDTAFDLLKSRDTFPGGSTDDYEFVRQMQMQAIVVRHWTDTNNWAVLADPFMHDGIEIGFVGGQEEPELFTQDDRNVGSYFDTDEITYKVRHSYGGTVLRHESAYGQIVV